MRTKDEICAVCLHYFCTILKSMYTICHASSYVYTKHILYTAGMTIRSVKITEQQKGEYIYIAK